MENLLGKSGIEIWRRANGIDESPVVPYHEQASISTENTFETDTIDLRFMQAQLVRMTEKIAHELRSQDKLTGCVTVKMRYSNFDTVTRQCSIPYTSLDDLLIKKVKELFAKLYDRRMLVRLIGVRFTHLVPGNYQINLFDDHDDLISTPSTGRIFFSWQAVKKSHQSAVLLILVSASAEAPLSDASSTSCWVLKVP